MAVVKTLVAPNGVTVRILDDAYANCTPEEMAERRREVRRVLDQIAVRAALAREREQATGNREQDQPRGSRYP